MQWPKLRILASRVMLDGIDRVATRLLWQDQTKLLRGSEVLYQYETSAISPNTPVLSLQSLLLVKSSLILVTGQIKSNLCY